jgi:pilus assembly protein FimV
VEDVFNQFKKGVEQTVRPEDTDTHYDLGIAYKEMGLVDDAIHEFEVALAGQVHAKEVSCLTMIGLCREMKGEHREAIQAFRRALRSEVLNAEAAKALHYELGLAHEAAGEPEVALWYFQKIWKLDPRYRDVAAAVERMGPGPARPPRDAEPQRAVGRAPPIGRGDRAGPDGTGPKKNIGYV